MMSNPSLKIELDMKKIPGMSKLARIAEGIKRNQVTTNKGILIRWASMKGAIRGMIVTQEHKIIASSISGRMVIFFLGECQFPVFNT